MSMHNFPDNAAGEIARVIDRNLRDNPKFLIAGLGVTDPKGVFGTTLGLVEKYGPERVIETPTSENAMTGIGVGLAISGFRPLLVHQRLDFFILAMDQLVNSAAKWNYMFGGKQSVPLTIRLITGRGWGQGPTHSQNLHTWFAHIPGLKVVMPAFSSDVASLLQTAIDDPNPVLFIEDRWIHSQQLDINDSNLDSKIDLGKARVVQSGKDLSVVAAGYMSIEALKAVNYLKTLGVSVDLIDLRSIKPLDMATINSSVSKTGRLLVVDSGHEFSNFGKEIISNLAVSEELEFKARPKLLCLPDVPEPTSYGVIGQYRISAAKIAAKALEILNREIPTDLNDSLRADSDDIPDSNFTGPF